MSIQKPRGARAAEPRDAILSPVAYPSCLLDEGDRKQHEPRRRRCQDRMRMGV